MTDSPLDTPSKDQTTDSVSTPSTPPDVLKPDTAAVSKELIPPEPVLEYPVYNHEVADSIIGTLKGHKVSPTAAQALFAEAVQSQDISKLNTKELEKLVGKDSADLITLRLDRFFKEEGAKKTAVLTGIHQAMGSEEITKTVIEWAKVRAKHSPEFNSEYQEYVRMFDSGAVQAKLAAKELKKAYEADPDNSSLGVQMTQGDTSASTSATPTELNRKTYLDAVKKAYADGNQQEVQRLRALRLQTLQKK